MSNSYGSGLSNSPRGTELLFALNPDVLTVQEYVQFLGPPPYSDEQCSKLRKKMQHEGYDVEEIVKLVGNGSNKPTGVFHAA